MVRILALAASAVGLACLSFFVFSRADSQVAKSIVVLQPTTPGTPQVGNANLSGKVIAGQFQGVGSGITGVNADLLDGLNSTAFLQSIPMPLSLTGNDPTYIIDAVNMSGSGGSAAIRGSSSATSGTSYGVYGISSGTYAGVGVGGVSYGTGNGSGGVSGLANAETGQTTGVSGYSHSTSGVGVKGIADNLGGSTYGGHFLSASFEGIGVYGEAQRNVGNTAGVYGITRSSSGVGVYGVAPASGTSIGVWGIGESPNGWAIYANGRSGASGTKSFRIDHPMDPENKWLLHYCAEGPEPLNVYSGAITTDASGFATIQLPDYFQEINRDPRVQLTIDDSSDDFVMAKVVGGVTNASCRIRTSKPGVKVYWEVKAVRNDRWMQKYGAPVEQEKAEQERGKYQHPELYGLPPEMGITSDRDGRTPRRR